MEKNHKDVQKILLKLRKLMDLQASATQCGELGEANAAAAGITRLLKEYDLSLQDIPKEAKELDPVGMDTIDYHFPYMQHRWYWDMLDVIARYNNASTIRTRHKNGLGKVVDVEYSVIGRKMNREVVLYLVSFLGNQFIRIGKDSYPKWRLKYMMTSGITPPALTVYMKSFLLGCVAGLDEKLRSEQQDLDTDKVNALVKVTRAEIDEFLQNMNVKDARNRKVNVYESAMKEGEEVGRNIQIRKGMAAEKKKTLMLE